MNGVQICPVKRRKFPELLNQGCTFAENDYSGVYYCIHCNRQAGDEE